MRKPHFARHLLFVTALHAILLAGLLGLTFIPGMVKRPEIALPAELVVEIPPGTEDGTDRKSVV